MENITIEELKNCTHEELCKYIIEFAKQYKKIKGKLNIIQKEVNETNGTN